MKNSYLVREREAEIPKRRYPEVSGGIRRYPDSESGVRESKERVERVERIYDSSFQPEDSLRFLAIFRPYDALRLDRTT